MTLTEFRRNANDFFHKNSQKMRYGQAIMVYLNGVNNVIYNGVPDWADPFYDNGRVEMLYQYLETVWTSN